MTDSSDQAEIDTTPQQVASLNLCESKVLAAINEEFKKKVGKVAGSEWENGQVLYHTHYAYEANSKITYVGKHPLMPGKSICISEIYGIVVVDDRFVSKESRHD